MKKIIIDLETANNKQNSICSIAYLDINEGIFKSSLINPETSFSIHNIKVHGISGYMCLNKPTIDEYFFSKLPSFENIIFIAHNAIFDSSVLIKSANYYGYELKHIKYICTMELASKIFPHLGKKPGLKLVAEEIKFSLKHHNALSDAQCCFEIYKLYNLKFPNNINKYIRTKTMTS
ncbi:MAG: 3'-5' exoribonuclease [Mycoplasmataceae bacterium]|nr:3'-5' exoribonuclease [Mycoplasmataceae bacterium]